MSFENTLCHNDMRRNVNSKLKRRDFSLNFNGRSIFNVVGSNSGTALIFIIRELTNGNGMFRVFYRSNEDSILQAIEVNEY